MPLVRATPVSPIFHRSGLYYGPGPSSGNSTRALTNIRNWYVPIFIPRARAYDRIGIEVTVAGTTAALRFGIFLDDAAGRPGARLFDAGTVTPGAPGVSEITIAQTIPAGIVWGCIVQQGAAADSTVRATGSFIGLYPGASAADGYGQGNTVGWTTSAGNGDAGAFPSTATLTGLLSTGTAPAIALRAA